MHWRALETLYRLLIPGGVIVLAVWVLVERWAPAATASSDVQLWPPFVLAAALLLALWFHETRLATAILVIGLIERGQWLVSGSGLDPADAAALRHLLTVLLPLNLLWVSWLPRRGRFAGRGSLVALGVQAVAFAVLLSNRVEDRGRLEHWIDGLVSPWGLQWSLALAPLAVVLALPTLSIAAWRAFRHGSAADQGMLWASVAALLALVEPARTTASALYMLAAAVVLVLALLQSSYRMAFHDELTGLPGRRALNDALTELGDTFSIAMVDIDHFKKFNDRFGHDVGDQVLAAVAGMVRRVGGGGRGFRYGGEEFAILFSGQGLRQVRPHLDSLRRTIEKSPFTLRSADRPRRKPKPQNTSQSGKKKPARRKPSRSTNRFLTVTVSIGLAQMTAKRSDPNAVLKAADQALYRAKRNGRNQVRT